MKADDYAMTLDADVSVLGNSMHEEPREYRKLRHVYDDAIEGGALRDGGAPKLFSRDYIGLVAQYAAVGVIDGVLPNVVYPFLQNYLNISGAQTTTASVLVQLPWSFKVFYGILSDCFPIRGYRRRPYMLIGWLCTLATLVWMASSPAGEPYYTDPSYRDVKPEDYTEEIIATINYEAVDEGSKYIMPMMLCAFGYLMADVCSDGFVVELAQREPANVRGHTQTVIYTTRWTFTILAQVLIAVGFNGEDYGGSFTFSLSFPILMLIIAIIIVPIVPVTWFFIREERTERIDFRVYISTLWEILQTRAVYQYIAYVFFSGIFVAFTYTSKNPIQTSWLSISPLNEKIAGVLTYIVFSASIWFAGKYGTQWDWRITPIVTQTAFVTLDAIVKLVTIFDLYRNEWFWLLIPVVEQIPLGIVYIVSSFIIVELSAEGHEGAMYGLLTTVYNLATPFATAIVRNVNSQFNLTTERIQNDSQEVRRDIMWTVLIMYVVNMLSLAFLVWLPRQKEETQIMKRLGASSWLMGAVTVGYLMFALVWSVTTNILSIFPSTSCLTIAGGDGC